MLHSNKIFVNTVSYVFIIDKMACRPDEKASRAAFGPRAVVWRPLVYVKKMLTALGEHVLWCGHEKNLHSYRD